MSTDDAWNIETPTPRNITINDSDTLEQVARKTAEFFELTPLNTERLMADWLAEWAEHGFVADDTVEQVQADLVGDSVWDRLCALVLGKYTDYRTDSQLADFIRINLLRVTNKNVLSSLSALARRSNEPVAQRLLQTAKEAISVLDSNELSVLLHDLARLS
jgi:hypothetical protein